MAKIQNEDVKSSTELVAAGGTAAQLINDSKIYVTGNAINDTLANAINNGQIGGGGGSKNYLTVYKASLSGGTNNTGNGDFEKGSTTGWSLAHSALTSFIPTSVATAGTAFDSTHGGTAASANLALTVVSSGQLQKTYSGSLASSAASVAGDMMISSPFYIDAEDQAKVLSFKFFYKAVSGTFNFSGSSSNTFAVYIYSVTDGAWIQPSGVYNLVQGSGVGVATGTFQTSSSGTQYQIALVNINATAGSYTLYVDDFAVGPQVTAIGPAMSDWTSFTPTITATTTNPTLGTTTKNAALYRRVGDSMEITYNLVQTAAGTAGSGAYLFALPSGLSIDLNKASAATIVASTTGINYGANYVGYGWVSQTATGNTNFADGAGVSVYDSTHLTLTTFGTVAGQSYPWSSGNLAISNANLVVSFTALVPIVGWSSNTVQSSDVDLRQIALSATNTSAVSGTITTLTANWTTAIDTHGAFSSGVWTCPSTDVYTITASVGAGATVSTTQSFIQVNGSTVRSALAYSAAVGSGVAVAQYTAKITQGQTVQMQAYSSGGGTANANQTYLQIIRAAGNAIVSATESICASGANTAGTAIGTSLTTIPFATKYYDSHNAYNSSVANAFVVPAPGRYRVSLMAGSIGTLTLPTASGIFYIAVQQAGSASVLKYLGQAEGTGGANIYIASGSETFNCLAGDTLTFQAASSTATTLNTGAGINHFSIERIP